MTMSKNQTIDAPQQGQENFATQVQNKVNEFGDKMQDLKDQAFQAEPPKPEPKTAGEQLDEAVETTKNAVGEKVDEAGQHIDSAVETTKTAVGERMEEAGQALKDHGEAVAPKEDKTLLEQLDAKLEQAKEQVSEEISNVVGGTKEEEKPKTIGDEIDSLIANAQELTAEKQEEITLALADSLSKAGDALQDAGHKAKQGDE